MLLNDSPRPLGRGIVAAICGVVVAFVVILVVEVVGQIAVPTPGAPSLKDAEQIGRYLATLPVAAYAFVIAAYFLGSFAGGIVAVRITGSRRSRSVWVVGALVLAATVANLILVPHPGWFTPVALIAIFLGTWLSTSINPGRKSR